MVEFKCFFSYYGSKAKIASYYKKPKYSTIVEPFCGAANYSVRHYQNQVYLCDLNDHIIKTWEFLINASSKDILSLPKFEKGLDLRKLDLSDGERYFCGYWASRGSNSPRNVVSTFAVGNSNGSDYFENIKQAVSNNLFRIKHWQVKKISYDDLSNNIKATWYIDPPYIDGGVHYIHNNIDYDKLAAWCLNRNGEIIVCENANAEWLDFKPLVNMTGQSRTKVEAVYYSDDHK